MNGIERFALDFWTIAAPLVLGIFIGIRFSLKQRRMNLSLLYEGWLEEIQSGVAEPPVSLLKYQRMGIDRKIEFLSGLGFSEHFAETLKKRGCSKARSSTWLSLITQTVLNGMET